MVKKIFLLPLLCCFVSEMFADDWNAALLDTARDADYMSAVEKDVVFELNKARSDPQRYAEEYIRPRIAYFSGKIYAEPGKPRISTNEGINAVYACIGAMARQQSAPPLTPERGMCFGAQDHVRDLSGSVAGHMGNDKSDPAKRMSRYGQWTSTWGENIAYGGATGRDIVIELLIDDGSSNRVHYNNNMNKAFSKIGVAVAPHKGYGSVCVIDFAGGYTTNATYAAPPVPVAPGEMWTVVLANKSGGAWSKLYIAGKRTSTWGNDVLAGVKIRHDDRIALPIPKDVAVYDIKIVADTGQIYHLFNLDRNRHVPTPSSSGVQHLFYVEKFVLTTTDTSGRK
ncbi:MAG: CAP domain-containing protein [Treponema sp.]|nr:CAP domain-containing protein [Treponema sp.]